MTPAAAPKACTFCEILAGARDASIVDERAETVAFLDHSPLFKGHVLVVPRVHVETLPELEPALLHALGDHVQAIAAAIPPALDAHGTFVALNNVVSQSVPHVHWHVVPRRRKDGLRGFFWPREKYADAGEAQEYARRIQDALTAG